MIVRNYSFDLLANSDSNRRASIMLPATFKRPDVNAFTHKYNNDENYRIRPSLL